MYRVPSARGSDLFRRNPVSLALFAMSVTVAGYACVPTADAAARPKADLVVRAFTFKSSPPHESAGLRHVVMDAEGRGEFAVVYTVKNLGDRRSPASTARVVVNGHKVGDEPVGPIRAGGRRTFTHRYTARFRMGDYETFACADWGDQVNESDEHNNCNVNVGFVA